MQILFDNFSEIVEDAQRWVDQGIASGWLSDRDRQAISSIQIEDPSTLFSDSVQRPLVVAFFGGTGVGKSSLLNRLAGQGIARTGVERPTSREISAYLHNSVKISRLPADYPTDKITIAHHYDDEKKAILWLDMPDIDSTEDRNREIVFKWLPHIDVLIYVVSPERYRDNKGWRTLLSHGHSHAWLFVMNHWDNGREVQFEAFRAQIEKADFDDPILLRTDCLNGTPDDFDQLLNTIISLATDNTINQLEARGFRMRLDLVIDAVARSRNSMGADDAQSQLEKKRDAEWKQTEELVTSGLDWPIKEFAKLYIDKGLKALPTTVSESESGGDIKNGYSPIWDAWAQTRVSDAMDNLVINSDELKVPVKPLKTRIKALTEKASSMIQVQIEQSLREEMSNPGNALQRFFLQFAKLMAFVLPLSAIGWVSYRLFNSYYQLGVSGGSYLGINFAVHSALLIAAAWLLPWFLSRKLKPSEESVAIDGMKKGLEKGLKHIAEQTQQAIQQTFEERQEISDAGLAFIARCENFKLPDQKTDNETLSRVLLKPGAGK